MSIESDRDAVRFDGGCAAVEGPSAWFVGYTISLADGWQTCSARVSTRSTNGHYELVLEADGHGRWQLNGAPAGWLDGCLDVDLESSALTNAFPVHRLALEVGEAADAPAAYVRAQDLAVQRLEQRYVRLGDEAGRERYHYTAPAFDFECELLYDEHGLVLEYPGLAVRAS